MLLLDYQMLIKEFILFLFKQWNGSMIHLCRDLLCFSIEIVHFTFSTRYVLIFWILRFLNLTTTFLGSCFNIYPVIISRLLEIIFFLRYFFSLFKMPVFKLVLFCRALIWYHFLLNFLYQLINSIFSWIVITFQPFSMDIINEVVNSECTYSSL